MFFRILKISWFLACLAVLLITVFFFDGTSGDDIEILYTWGIQLLSFPCGILLSLIISGVFYLLNNLWGIIVSASMPYFLLTWAAYCLVGYIQWFWLIPKLILFYKGPR